MSYADVWRALMHEPSGLYEVHVESQRLRPNWLFLDHSPFLSETVWLPELRDCNATAGTWQEVIRLAHLPVEYEIGGRFYSVPSFHGDPERAVWRRRKWWGRGPIKPWRPAHYACPDSSWCSRTPWCEFPNCLPF